MKTTATRRGAKKFFIATIVFSLIVTYGALPNFSKAITFSGMEDTISDSDPDASAQSVTHTIIATTTVVMGEDAYFQFDFPSDITDVSYSNLTCPSAGTASSTNGNLTCTYGAGGLATGTHTFVLANTTNPISEGSYIIRLYSYASTTAEHEKGTMRIAIVNDVEVSATVEATLTFRIEGTATSSDINGAITTGSSTDSTLAFGIIDSSQAYTLGQQLYVTTNAASGYSVTVQQDGNLQTAGGADIDSFDDGVAASTTPAVWSAPAGSLALGENTYGHFGFTALDASLSDGDPFETTKYKGFYGTDAVEIMYHNGPADGSTTEIGSSTVAYTMQINDLQEAGDYTSLLTYICTPKY